MTKVPYRHVFRVMSSRAQAAIFEEFVQNEALNVLESAYFEHGLLTVEKFPISLDPYAIFNRK